MDAGHLLGRTDLEFNHLLPHRVAKPWILEQEGLIYQVRQEDDAVRHALELSFQGSGTGEIELDKLLVSPRDRRMNPLFLEAGQVGMTGSHKGLPHLKVSVLEVEGALEELGHACGYSLGSFLLPSLSAEIPFNFFSVRGMKKGVAFFL